MKIESVLDQVLIEDILIQLNVQSKHVFVIECHRLVVMEQEDSLNKVYHQMNMLHIDQQVYDN
jgi:DNA polymerase III psi subunit